MEMEKDKIVFKGSHPDSLYRVSADNGVSTSKVTRVLRVLRWPAALVAVCVALAVFVYFLMPDNLESRTVENVTYYDPAAAGPRTHAPPREHHDKKPLNVKLGTKTSEIDFYDAENNKNTDLHTAVDTIADSNPKRKLPVPPVFPTHLTPEVQYGNEKADAGNLRTPKLLEDTSTEDSTLKPHITQKPEKPLAIYFKNGSSANTGLITRPETFNDFTKNDHKPVATKNVEYAQRDKSQSYTEHLGHQGEHEQGADKYVPLEVGEFYARRPNVGDISFTSGHSKLFGISIEDAEKMKSTTQSSLYNTRVSPTLPTWRDGDDTTTKKYPSNIYSEVQCHSTRMALCRGILPYDLAEAPAKIGSVEVTSLLSQIDYLVATNCSDRVRHFMCALLEPECNPPPYPTKKPCYGLCKAIADACEGQIPAELTPLFNCKQYSRTSCVAVKTPCYPREFSCNDGSCVPRDWMCDGTKDCPSGEDEATCVKCDQSEYRCSTGECILKRWLCDGYSDCPDGEDEHVETCGTRTPHTVIADAHEPGSLHAAADTHEPGEESAGSAPAPAVRRPNRVQHKQKIANQRIGENESSKELLITSDSNNSLKRNLTRRPLPPRLSHYYPVQPTRPTMIEISKALVHEPTPTKQKLKNPEEEKVAERPVPEKESIEDVNMGDLGFFDEFEKESKDQPKEPVEQKPEPPIKIARFGVPQPKPPKQTAPNRVWPAPTQPTPVDKMANNFERVIDGAALLRKAAAEHAAEVAEDVSMNDTFAYVDKDEIQGPDPALTLPRVSPDSPVTKTGSVHRPGPVGPKVSKDKGTWSRAHASPCPSGELRCVDGRCITLAQLCDGTIDCTDHADEDNCYT